MPLRAVVILLALMLASAQFARAQEQRFAQYNFAITPPAGWDATPPPANSTDIVALFVKADKSEILTVSVHKLDKKVGDLNEDAAAFDRDFEQSGGKHLSSHFFEMAGVKAYEEIGVVNVNGKPVSQVADVAWMEDNAYVVQGLDLSSDAIQSPELRGSMKSFRFLARHDAAAPADNAAVSASSYWMGTIIRALVLVLVFFLLFLFFWRNRAPRSAEPWIDPFAGQGPPPPDLPAPISRSSPLPPSPSPPSLSPAPPSSPHQMPPHAD